VSSKPGALHLADQACGLAAAGAPSGSATDLSASATIQKRPPTTPSAPGAECWSSIIPAAFVRCGGRVRQLRHDQCVPRISEFYGIVIEMYFVDHPPPHFHARYSGDEALIVIETGEVFAGFLPGRALRLVRDWLDEHRAELVANWDRARAGQPTESVEPLR